MTIKSLEYFLVLAKHLNISKAAQELYISQPALSRQLKQLEEDLSAVLFERTNPMKLTPAGEVLIQEANDMFRKQTELYDRVRFAAISSSQSLHIGYMAGTLNGFLPSFIAKYRRQYPSISVLLDRNSSNQVFSDLLKNKIQIGFILSTVDTCPDPLAVKILQEADLYLAIPENHPVHYDVPVSLKDIHHETIFILDPAEAPLQHTPVPLFLHENTQENTVIYSADMGSIVAMVRSGIGISLIARDYCIEASDSLRFLPIKNNIKVKLCAAWNPTAQLPETKDFIRMLARYPIPCPAKDDKNIPSGQA